jgi:Cft2 family RNA processing exonuclease
MAAIKITDLNTHGGIGANSYLVEFGRWRMVIDTGLHPKYAGNEAVPNYSLVSDDSLDLILVTHAHLDHLGSLPVLARRHPDARVIMSSGTSAIAGRMLRNSVQVMKYQREELGIPEYPLYTRGEITILEDRILPMEFMRPLTLGESDDDELEIELHPSGHIPGAASVRISHGGRTILFSGDIQFQHQHILDGAYVPDIEPDLLVLETTRGATPPKPDGSREKVMDELLQTVSKILKQGGSCLIPVFALGRMQEMLAVVQMALHNGKLPPTKVFCSGLGMDIVNYFDLLSRKKGYPRFDRSILKDLGVKPPSRDLKPGRNPGERGLYLVSSGMLVEKTPSYKLAASILDDPANGICFIGYCDPDTPGGQLKECQPGDRFYFEELNHEAQVNAEIHRFDITGHAERDELLDFAKRQNPRKILLTHGDPEARQWFRDNLPGTCPDAEVVNPKPGRPTEI